MSRSQIMPSGNRVRRHPKRGINSSQPNHRKISGKMSIEFMYDGFAKSQTTDRFVKISPMPGAQNLSSEAHLQVHLRLEGES